MNKTMQSTKPKWASCACQAAPQMIFACSGSSDVGELADRAARVLSKAGPGKMFCLAGLAGQVTRIVTDMKKAEKVLVIDGCAADCAANALRQAGYREFDHLRICEMELAQGDAAICNVNLQKVVEKGRAMLEGWSTGT